MRGDLQRGTIALEIAIRAVGLTGEVIIPSYTFIATAHALHWQTITPRTSGITGVHLWGRSAAVEELQAIADEFNLKLMFDAAHAFASSHKVRMIGSFGTCEVFSFHATKFFKLRRRRGRHERRQTCQYDAPNAQFWLCRSTT